MLGFNGGRLGLKNTVERNGIVGPSTDPYYDDVGLILNGGDFIDGSKYAATVTATSVDLDSVITHFGEASYDINSHNDFLGVADQGQFDLGTNDFTIEGWVYLITSNNTRRSVFQKADGSGSAINYIRFALGSGNTFRVYASSNGSTWDIASDLDTLVAPTFNDWTHYAVCREGSNIRVFVGGVLANTITTSLPISNDPTAAFEVGTDNNNGSFDGGRVGGARVTNGVARYTANFTPPTSTFNTGAVSFKASGMWTLAEQERLRYQAIWPGNDVPVSNGLVVYLDSAQSASYPGTGATWTNIAPGAATNSLSLTGTGYTYSSDFGGVIDFDGVDGYAESNSTLAEAGGLFADASNSWSVTAFFYVDSLLGQRNSIVSRSTTSTSSATFAMNHNNDLIQPIIRGNSTSGPDITTKVWYESTITWDGSNASLYLNGVYNMRLGVGGSSEQTSSTFEVGTFGAATSNGIDGKVPVVLIYNRALTASEVSRNFNTFRDRYSI